MAPAGTPTRVHPSLSGRFAVLPYQGTDVQASSTAKIKLWSSSITYNGTTYKYKMVGKNPFSGQPSPSTTTPTPVIPVVVTLGSTVFDPTAADPTCSPAGVPFTLVQQSPVFVSHSYSPGGTSLSGQYLDVFQRTNFWTETNPSGVNPNYHVNLNPTFEPVLSYATGGYLATTPCGKIGIIDIDAWDSYLRSTAFAQLSGEATPATFPVFILYNVVFYNGTPSSCCILGYHSAFSNPSYSNTFQTYAVADYDTSQGFSGISDVEPLSHEVGEWMDDPTTKNKTPAWGHIGQVSGCQKNLEVGDPLSGTTLAVTMSNGFTYHPQELAFFSWFYRQSPSIGIHGWYSSNGTFTTASAPCS